MITALLFTLAVAATPAPDAHPKLMAVAKTLLPVAGAPPIEIRPSAIPDMFEVSQGTQVFYLSADGNHVLAGPLFEVATRKDLTAQRQAQARISLLQTTQLSTPLVYPSSQSDALRVTVVTNIDCTFCRRLHAQLDEYTASGIELNYVILPSGGGNGFERSAALMCESDPTHAFSEALLGNEPPGAKADCEHNLNQHIALATQLGAASTPNLILPTGELIQGYQTPEQLRARLNP
ncbi:MAG: DsbC family protein [Lysobacterales bacterium]